MSTRSGKTFQGASDASLTDDALPATSNAPPAAQDGPGTDLPPDERWALPPPLRPTLSATNSPAHQSSPATQTSQVDSRTSGKQPTLSDLSAAHRSSPGATQTSQVDSRTSGGQPKLPDMSSPVHHSSPATQTPRGHNRTSSSKQSSESDSSSSASGGRVAELTHNVGSLQKTVEKLADTLKLAMKSGDDIPAPMGSLHSRNPPANSPVHRDGNDVLVADGRDRALLPGGSSHGSYQPANPPVHRDGNDVLIAFGRGRAWLPGTLPSPGGASHGSYRPINSPVHGDGNNVLLADGRDQAVLPRTLPSPAVYSRHGSYQPAFSSVLGVRGSVTDDRDQAASQGSRHTRVPVGTPPGRQAAATTPPRGAGANVADGRYQAAPSRIHTPAPVDVVYDRNQAVARPVRDVRPREPVKINKERRRYQRRYVDSSDEDDGATIYTVPSVDRDHHLPAMGAQSPKLPPFTGKESWAIWFARFEDVADRHHWGHERRLNELLPKLYGDSGEFAYGQLTKQVRRDYPRLVAELNSRFRVVETHKSFAAKFSVQNQIPGETPEAYAAELKRLYDRGYPNRDTEIRREDLLRRFLDGLYDEHTSFQVEFVKDPHSIEEAVFHTVTMSDTRSRQTRKSDGEASRRRHPIRGVHDEETSPGTEQAAQATFVPKKTPLPGGGGKPSAPGSSSSDQAAVIEQLKKKVESLEAALACRATPSGKAANGSRACYRCGSTEHLVRGCPHAAPPRTGPPEQLYHPAPGPGPRPQYAPAPGAATSAHPAFPGYRPELPPPGYFVPGPPPMQRPGN